MNTIGKNLRLSTFGESHGPAMGGILDGFPPGFCLDFDRLQAFIDRRRPGQSPDVTARNEADRPEFLSGFSADGLTLGSPIAFIVRNKDCRSADYNSMNDAYRPNHADYTYLARYGLRDPRGGGRASARDTLGRVVAGGMAIQWLESKGVGVEARLVNEEQTRAEALRAKAEGDSVGGIVECTISGLPRGLGNPVFGKFQAELAAAIMAINAAMGFEYGVGFAAAEMRGSEMADQMSGACVMVDALPEPKFLSNHCGGLNGGITNGCPVTFRVAFKPTPTIARELQTTGPSGSDITLCSRGRHDPCVAIRAVPVVEAMAALVAADFLLGDPRPNY